MSHLKTAAQKGRLAHAYLFLGPEGVGKASHGPGPGRGPQLPLSPGGRRRLRGLPLLPPPGGGHPSRFSGDRAHSGGAPKTQPQIKIEQIREFRRLTAYPPLGGGWRVVLIKPAEAMNEARGQRPAEDPGGAAAPAPARAHRPGGGRPFAHRGLPLPQAGLRAPARRLDRPGTGAAPGLSLRPRRRCWPP